MLLEKKNKTKEYASLKEFCRDFPIAGADLESIGYHRILRCCVPAGQQAGKGRKGEEFDDTFFIRHRGFGTDQRFKARYIATADIGEKEAMIFVVAVDYGLAVGTTWKQAIGIAWKEDSGLYVDGTFTSSPSFFLDSTTQSLFFDDRESLFNDLFDDPDHEVVKEIVGNWMGKLENYVPMEGEFEVDDKEYTCSYRDTWVEIDSRVDDSFLDFVKTPHIFLSLVAAVLARNDGIFQCDLTPDGIRIDEYIPHQSNEGLAVEGFTLFSSSQYMLEEIDESMLQYILAPRWGDLMQNVEFFLLEGSNLRNRANMFFGLLLADMYDVEEKLGKLMDPSKPYTEDTSAMEEMRKRDLHEKIGEHEMDWSKRYVGMKSVDVARSGEMENELVIDMAFRPWLIKTGGDPLKGNAYLMATLVKPDDYDSLKEYFSRPGKQPSMVVGGGGGERDDEDDGGFESGEYGWNEWVE